MTSPFINTTNTHKTLEQQIDESFINLNSILSNAEMDHSKMIEQALRIVIMQMRNFAKSDKDYALDKEEELWVHVNVHTGTFNSKTVFIMTVAYAGITIAAGVIGLASIVPGTSLATSLIGKGFTLLSGGAETGKKMYTVSQVASQFAQIFPALQKFPEEKNQSIRVMEQHLTEAARQKSQNRHESSQSNKQDGKAALQSLHEQEQKRSQNFTEMTRTTAS